MAFDDRTNATILFWTSEVSKYHKIH